MENVAGRKEAPVEVRDVRGEPSDKTARSCLDCDHLIARGGWPHCNFYDKTTSLEIKPCSGFARR